MFSAEQASPKMVSHTLRCSITIARKLKKIEHLERKKRKLCLVTCLSNKPMIKHSYVRVAFKKKKDVHERFEWIVTIYDTPSDIMRYDEKVISRLRGIYYTPKAKNKEIIIREILDVVELSRSQITLDEHKKMYNR